MTICVLDLYDSLLFDLDGTVWEGGRLLPHAAELINTTTLPVMYITNNASRHPRAVADMLTTMSIPTAEQQVLTSAQAAILMAAQHLNPGDSIYVVGTDSFKDLVREAGFNVATSADENPKAVLHGHNPETGWAQLSEAALAIQRGARYFASNLDSTLPMERGFMVGNGSMVQAVIHATGVSPSSAGKPAAAMFHTAAGALNSVKPLAVGDRLDTDIAGGVAAGYDTFHLLTGVSKHWSLVHAPCEHRPTYIAENLADIHAEPTQLSPSAQGEFHAHRNGDTITLSGGTDDSTSTHALRTVLAQAWTQPEAFDGTIEAQSEHAHRALQGWLP